MTPSEERFRAKVRQQGDHEVWSGARDARGTGLVRIDGSLRTVQRAAWEFAHGPLPPGARVLACPEERACVHLGHLRLDRPQTVEQRHRLAASAAADRSARSSPGVWELAVSLGPGPDGRTRRRYRTIHGGKDDADQALTDLVETAYGPSRLGDLRVPELLDRYLTWLDDGTATAPIESSPQDRGHRHRTRLRSPVRRAPRHRRHRCPAAGSTQGRRLSPGTEGDPRTPRRDLPLGARPAVDDPESDNGHPDP